MTIRRITALAITAASAIGLAACGSSGSNGTSGGSSRTGSKTINGAGSTFAAPIYEQWSTTLGPSGLTVTYAPVGSGTGVADLQTATVDFAGNDSPLKSDDRSGGKGPMLQFPVAFGAITISYNLPGVKSGLKLDGPTIANIFLGKVKTWNDAAIKALNPGISLPSTAITVVHRSDSSGTTDGFTKYLSAVSPTWNSQVGSGKIVKWPTGTGAAHNSGVAAGVKQTDGGVGYVEQAYAIENDFTVASVKNSSGTYVAPSIPATSAAANGIKVPPDLGISTINSPNPSAYPIASQTFIDVYKDPCKSGGASKSVADSMKSFLTYAFGDGQKTLGTGSGQLPYAPLTSGLVSKDQTQLGTMTCNGSGL
ncbi:MAG: phosphate ABC transporter substrate-binding protein PstS [Solirubrobacteraceae bacterium]